MFSDKRIILYLSFKVIDNSSRGMHPFIIQILERPSIITTNICVINAFNLFSKNIFYFDCMPRIENKNQYL